jgi:aminobenzoyl-glutamate transport protein
MLWRWASDERSQGMSVGGVEAAMAESSVRAAAASPPRGLLDRIERLGNRLPDPVTIFVLLIGMLFALSVLGDYLGWQATNPVTREALHAESLFAPKNLRALLTDMPKTFSGFPPLGIVLLIMLGAGIAERSGLLATAVASVVRRTSARLLTPVIILLGLLANQAADAGFIILVPLAGTVFAAAGRHPIAGMAAAFAGCAGSYSGNPLPSQFDSLMFGLTQTAARSIDPAWHANVVGNWWFNLGCAALLLPSAWIVTELVIEPRLGAWEKSEVEQAADAPDATLRRKGLVRAGTAALAVASLWSALALAPGAPLYDQAAVGVARWSPLLQSLTAFAFLLLGAAGIAYGSATGSVTGTRDAVGHATAAMASMAPYIVLAFVASHFISLFGLSNLAPIAAINGAEALQRSGLPVTVMLLGIVVITIVFDLLIGSAGAKWAVLAPVLVPMMMALGVSPEMTTAAYRVGDTSINMATPLMVYFPLVLNYCRQWAPNFGLGSLLAVMLPYSWAFTISALLLTAIWSGFALPVGPGAPFHYTLPALSSN